MQKKKKLLGIEQPRIIASVHMKSLFTNFAFYCIKKDTTYLKQGDTGKKSNRLQKHFAVVYIGLQYRQKETP